MRQRMVAENARLKPNGRARRRMGRVLDAHEARWPETIAAVRLLALTGYRRGEVLNLRWQDTCW